MDWNAKEEAQIRSYGRKSRGAELALSALRADRLKRLGGPLPAPAAKKKARPPGPSGPTTPGRSWDTDMGRAQPLDPVTSWGARDGYGYGHEDELRGDKHSRGKEDSQPANQATSSGVAYGASRGNSVLHEGGPPPRSDWPSGFGEDKANASASDRKGMSSGGRHEGGERAGHDRRAGLGTGTGTGKAGARIGTETGPGRAGTGTLKAGTLTGRAGRAPIGTRAFEAELGLFLEDDLEVEDEGAGNGKDAAPSPPSRDDVSKDLSDVSRVQAGSDRGDRSPVAPGTSGAKNPFALREPRARAEPLFPSNVATRPSREEGREREGETPEGASGRPRDTGTGTSAEQEGRRTRSSGDHRSRVHGLRNLGNTCYLNSVLQALSGLPCFQRSMRNALLQTHVASPGAFSALADLFESMATKPERAGPAVLNPALVKAALGRRYPEFRGACQQDAHELLCALLDSLHEDVKKAALTLFQHHCNTAPASLPPLAASAMRNTRASLAAHTATESTPGPGTDPSVGGALCPQGPGVPGTDPATLGLSLGLAGKWATGEMGPRRGEHTPKDSVAGGRGMAGGRGREEEGGAPGSGASGRGSLTARAERFADWLCPTCVNFSAVVEQRVECLRCGHVSTSSVEYHHFSLDIPAQADAGPSSAATAQPQPFELQRLLEGYFQAEEFERECEECSQKPAAPTSSSGHSATRNFSKASGTAASLLSSYPHPPPRILPLCRVTRQLKRTPRVLVLHLKRFSVEQEPAPHHPQAPVPATPHHANGSREEEPGKGRGGRGLGDGLGNESLGTKENALSAAAALGRGGTEGGAGPATRTAEPAPASKPPPVYRYVKKMERVAVPPELTLDSICATDAASPVEELGSCVAEGESASASRAGGAEGYETESVQGQEGMGTDEGSLAPPRRAHSASVAAASRDHRSSASEYPLETPQPKNNTSALPGRTPAPRASSPDPVRNPTPERKSVVRSLSSLWGARNPPPHPGALTDVTNREQQAGTSGSSRTIRNLQQRQQHGQILPQGQGQGQRQQQGEVLGQGQGQGQSGSREKWGPLFGRKPGESAADRPHDTPAGSLQSGPGGEGAAPTAPQALYEGAKPGLKGGTGAEGAAPHAVYGGAKPGLKGGAPARRTRSAAKAGTTGGSGDGGGGGVDGERRESGGEKADEECGEEAAAKDCGEGRGEGTQDGPALRSDSSDVKVEGATVVCSEGGADGPLGGRGERDTVEAAGGEAREGKGDAQASVPAGIKRRLRNRKAAPKNPSPAPATDPDSDPDSGPEPAPSPAPVKDSSQRSMLSFFRRRISGDAPQAKPREAECAAVIQGVGVGAGRGGGDEAASRSAFATAFHGGGEARAQECGARATNDGSAGLGEIRLGDRVDLDLPDAPLAANDSGRRRLSEGRHSPVTTSGQRARPGEAAKRGAGEAERGSSGYPVGGPASGGTRHGYGLTAVVHHLGESAHCGHYVADVWDPVAKRWTHHDDSLVQTVSFQDVVCGSSQSSSYLLFYVNNGISCW